MNVSKQEIIDAVAQQLKPVLKKPEWADFVKTGVFKQRPPVDSDWWYYRAASILLKVQKLEPVGVSKLRTKYGGRKNCGVAPEHFRRGSGKIIRLLLQQLETAGYLKQEKKTLHKGRLLTAKAKSLISKTAKALEKPRPKLVETPVVYEKKEEPVKEEPKKEEAKKEDMKKEQVKQDEAKKDDSKKEEAKHELQKPAKHEAKEHKAPHAAPAAEKKEEQLAKIAEPKPEQPKEQAENLKEQ